MSRVGLISNPGSELNKRNVETIEDMARSDAQVLLARFEGIEPLAATLESFARDDVGLVIVSGGDGSVQAVLTILLEQRPFADLPLVAILPRGMTNMTANDCGLTGGGARDLRRLLDAARAGNIGSHVVRRHVLRLDGIQGYDPQWGMFFGAAAISEAIRICRERVHSAGLKAHWATGATLAGLVVGRMLGMGGDVFAGEDVSWSVDDGAPRRTRLLLALATTLDRLILRSRPFWGYAGRPFRFTGIVHPPVRLLRSTWEILYGRETRRLDPDRFVSRGADRLEIRVSSPFTLDGQMFDPDPARPLVITAPAEVGFVRL
jgi:hypothetical protein